jgi:hypothetical protein
MEILNEYVKKERIGVNEVLYLLTEKNRKGEAKKHLKKG